MAIKPIQILISAKDEASGVFSSLQAKAAGVAAAILAYFGIDAFASAVKSAADFEAALSRVQAATGGTKEELAQLRKAAEESGVDSTQAAGALENLAKAGLSAKEAIGALPAVINLARAGDLDLAHASEVVTAAVMGMGLKFGETARVVDVLVMGANETKTSVKGLAEALSYAAPVASSMGISLESTVAIIGQFAQAGIDASRAGTALNSILSQFNDPASKFRQELAAAGITTGNFETALHQLAKAGPAGAKAINAVGLEAGPALLAMLNRGMPALDALTAKLKSAEGAAAEAAKVMQTNLNGSLLDLQTAWKYVKDTLATPVLPVITGAVNELTQALRGAVQEGTISRFGDAIAVGFKAGIAWIKDFKTQINFTQVAADLRQFADRTGEVFTQISQSASTAGNAVKLAYGVMSSGSNLLLSGIYMMGAGMLAVTQKLLDGMALLYQASAKVTFGGLSAQYAQIAKDISLASDGIGASVKALGEKSRESFTGVGVGAQLARDGFEKLAEGATSAAPALSGTAEKMQAINKAMLETPPAAKATAEAAKTISAAAVEQKQAADTARAAMEQLIKEYNALKSNGDLQGAAEKMQAINKAMLETPPAAKDAAKATTDKKLADEAAAVAIHQLRAEYAELIAKGDLQGAAEKIKEINKALQGTPAAAADATKAAAEAAKIIDAAFAGLGITSQAALKKVADSAKIYYDQIKGDANSTAIDVANAFEAYAKKAIEANGGVAAEAIKVEAAMRGLSVQSSATGDSIVKASGESAQAVDGLTQAYQRSGSAAQTAADNAVSALERQNAAIERANAATEKAIELENKRLNIDKEGFALNTAGERISLLVPTRRSVYEQAKSQGLDDAQSLQISKEYITDRGDQTGYHAGSASNWSMALQDAINKLVLQNAQTRADAEKAKSATTSTSTATSSSQTITINIPGVVSGIKVADQSSADALIAALKSGKLAAGA